MMPSKSVDRADEDDGDMLPLEKMSSMRSEHCLLQRGSGPWQSHRLARTSSSASTTPVVSLCQAPVHNCDDEPLGGIQSVIQFIQELGDGMDKLYRRMDKFEGVLDHLELDGLRHADEISDLKECIDQGGHSLTKLSDVTVHLERCDREQQRQAELLAELLGVAEVMEQRQAELQAAALADVEKACLDSLERYWVEAGAAQVQKACEDALEHLRLDLDAIAKEAPQHDLNSKQSFEISSSTTPSPHGSPRGPRLSAECMDQAIHIHTMGKIASSPRPGAGTVYQDIDAKCNIVVEHYLSTLSSEGISELSRSLCMDRDSCGGIDAHYEVL